MTRRERLKKDLEKCTKEQQELFFRFYPEGVDKIRNTKINHAHMQVRNTLKKNMDKDRNKVTEIKTPENNPYKEISF